MADTQQILDYLNNTGLLNLDLAIEEEEINNNPVLFLVATVNGKSVRIATIYYNRAIPNEQIEAIADFIIDSAYIMNDLVQDVIQATNYSKTEPQSTIEKVKVEPNEKDGSHILARLALVKIAVSSLIATTNDADFKKRLENIRELLG